VLVFVLTSIAAAGARNVIGEPPPVKGFPQLLQNADCALLAAPHEEQEVGERAMLPTPLAAKLVAA